MVAKLFETICTGRILEKVWPLSKKLDPRGFLEILALGAAVLVVPGRLTADTPAATRPNIVFIMADDMGIGDVGCYNPQSLIPTPHIDRLAREGVRLTDAHSPSAVCTPTRYGVLTGRYCWRSPLKSEVLYGYEHPLIKPERMTVASLLKKHGYATACIGKWHLGLGWSAKPGMKVDFDRPLPWPSITSPELENKIDFSKPITGGPNALGFDYAFYTSGCSPVQPPYGFIENDRMVEIPSVRIPRSYRARPGLMAPSWKQEDADPTFTNKAIEFIEKQVKEHPQQPWFVYFATSAPHAPWLPPDFCQGKSKEGPRGDLVVLVDWCVGQVLDTLQRLKLAENTLVIVTSDNGPRVGRNGHKSAGPYRGYKSHIWEGGHRVPFIARWPGRIQPGTASDELICLSDLAATCAAIVGEKLPRAAGEDSYNVLPALLGQKRKQPIREHIVHHSVWGVFSIRQGAWKLILETKTSGGWEKPRGSGPKPGTPGQLYNIADDPYETTDLWEKRPEIVRRLTKLLEKSRRQGRSRP